VLVSATRTPCVSVCLWASPLIRHVSHAFINTLAEISRTRISYIEQCERREENKLDATECFIALIICSTCFGQLSAHHHELETILVLLPHMVCNALFVGGRLLGVEQQAMSLGRCCTPNSRPPATKALHTICGNNTSIVSSSWWWTYKCPKHVEHIISAIKHSAASSWFSSLRLYNDARTDIHQTEQCVHFYYRTFTCNGCSCYFPLTVYRDVCLWRPLKILQFYSQELIRQFNFSARCPSECRRISYFCTAFIFVRFSLLVSFRHW
jgi:hypothetical protein